LWGNWHNHLTVFPPVRRKCILITVYFVIVLRRNQPKFESPCSDQCVCDEELFSPICGADGITYFSACHAGCRNRTSGKEYITGYKVPNIILFVYLLRYYIGYIAIMAPLTYVCLHSWDHDQLLLFLYHVYHPLSVVSPHHNNMTIIIYCTILLLPLRSWTLTSWKQ